MFWQLVDIGVNLVEILLIFIFLRSIYRFRVQNKLYIIGLLILQTIILTAINMKMEDSSLVSMGLIVFSIGSLSYLIFEEKLVTIMVPTLLWISIMGIIEFSFVSLATFSFNEPIETFTDQGISKIMLFALSRGVLYIIIRDFSKYNLLSKSLKKVYMFEIIIILLLDMAILLSIPRLVNHSLGIGFSTVFITILIISVSVMLIRMIDTIMGLSIQSAEYEVQVQYVRNMDKFVQQLRAQRHDFNHHIGCIHGLLEIGNDKEAKEYVDDLFHQAEQVSTLVSTNDAYVTAILNHKLGLAKAEHISLRVKVDLPKQLNIKPVDLSVILGNALDNAIEACKKVEESAFIIINISEQLNYLCISIENSKVPTVTNFNETTKEDKENHGFGLKNIQYVVDLYAGTMEVNDLGDKFAFKAIINNEMIKNSKKFKKRAN